MYRMEELGFSGAVVSDMIPTIYSILYRLLFGMGSTISKHAACRGFLCIANGRLYYINPSMCVYMAYSMCLRLCYTVFIVSHVHVHCCITLYMYIPVTTSRYVLARGELKIQLHSTHL